MFKGFYPDKMVDNVFQLDEDFYICNGIKGVVFDIDNTLVTHETLIPTDEIKNYFENLRKIGIRTAIVSNNYEERVELFCAPLNVPYISRAWKPFKKHLSKIPKIFSLSADEICLVGDQIFTDIYGGKRMEFYTVLVTAVGENETGFVAFKRIFEKMVLNEYLKSQKNDKNCKSCPKKCKKRKK